MTSTQENTHKSENVEVTVKKKPDCMVELLVKASESLVQSSYRKAIKSVAKEVSLPGFRKGKAPEALIVKSYKKPLEDRWQREIADTAFKEAQKVAKVPMLSQDTRISFDMKEKTESSAEMLFAFETEPAIPDFKPEDLEVIDLKPETIDDAKVDETIEHIRSFFGTWEDVTDRAVQTEDYVTVDIENLELDPPEKSIANQRFRVHKENMAEWMLDLVVGMKTGDAKEGMSNPDKDAPESVKADTPAKKVRVTVLKIEKQILPAVDDELAKKVGVATADEMKTRLKDLLTHRAEKEATEAKRDYIADELIKACSFDLPQSILQRELQHRMKQLMEDKSYVSKLSTMSEDDKKAEVEKIKAHAENAIRLFYICRHLCEKYKIDVQPDDVSAKVKTPLDAMFVDRSEFYDYKSLSQEQQAIVLSRVMLQKAEDFLIEKAKKVKAPEKKAEAKKVAAKKTAKKAPAKKAVKKTAAKKSAKKASTSTKSATKKRKTSE